MIDKARQRRKRRQKYRELRWEALLTYSTPEARAKNEPACIRCGYRKNSVALSIHHSDNTGAKHRRQIGRSSSALYRWLKRKKYPKHFETLCMNCQRIEEFRRSQLDLAKRNRQYE